MLSVTTIARASRRAAIAPTRSMYCINRPPNKLPSAFESAGNTISLRSACDSATVLPSTVSLIPTSLNPPNHPHHRVPKSGCPILAALLRQGGVPSGRLLSAGVEGGVSSAARPYFPPPIPTPRVPHPFQSHRKGWDSRLSL